MRLLNYNYVWGKRCVFNNFLKISNELADLISVGSLFHALAAVTVKVRSPALVRVLGQQIRNTYTFTRTLAGDRTLFFIVYVAKYLTILPLTIRQS